eukprot:5963791-Prymnesium_polylepis.1
MGVQPPELTAIDAADVGALLRVHVGPLLLWLRRDGAARPQLALMVGGEVWHAWRGAAVRARCSARGGPVAGWAAEVLGRAGGAVAPTPTPNCTGWA